MYTGTVHPSYSRVAAKFGSMYTKPSHGGGALAIHRHGEPIVDVWAGWADPHGTRPWQRDTMAMSFSTSKGVASVLVHRLAEQGILGYDESIAHWWPEFAANGKAQVTVRHLLSHRTGLYRARGLVDDARDLLDWRAVADRLAASTPELPVGGPPCYHGITYGWLVAGLVERATGRTWDQLMQEEIVDPLDLDGCFIGLPDDEHDRVAQLFPGVLPLGMTVAGFASRMEKRRATKRFVDALCIDGFDNLSMSRAILRTVMPAVNGVFTARSLSRIYAAMANSGAVEGRRLLKEDTVSEIGRVQTRERDRALFLNMRWRLGFHQAFTMRNRVPKGFGHFGYGGSGGWADPETGLSVAFVTNRLGNATTPVGDARLARLGDMAVKAARSE